MKELKEYDPVMVSEDGKSWICTLYHKNNSTFDFFDLNDTIVGYWKYIIPLYDFDFNDLESNIKRSVT